MYTHQLKKIGFFLVLPLLLLLFIATTDPYRLPLPLLMVPFFLFAATIYQWTRAIMVVLKVTRRKSRIIATMVTALLLLVALLQSIHQLSTKDLLISIALLLGLTIYLRRLDL